MNTTAQAVRTTDHCPDQCEKALNKILYGESFRSCSTHQWVEYVGDTSAPRETTLREGIDWITQLIHYTPIDEHTSSMLGGIAEKIFEQRRAVLPISEHNFGLRYSQSQIMTGCAICSGIQHPLPSNMCIWRNDASEFESHTGICDHCAPNSVPHLWETLQQDRIIRSSGERFPF